VADLLECLAQIRALVETAPRVELLVRTTAAERWLARPVADVWAPVEVLAHLADVELVYAARLLGMISAEQPHLQELDPAVLARRSRYLERRPEDELQRFQQRREGTLAELRSCSAAELERTGIDPRRGVITVADLVADMLAHDTVHVGQIRQRLAIVQATGSSSLA
jgi:uncharacterized damage-inducible protein DinB